MRWLNIALVLIGITSFALSGCNGIENGAILPDIRDIALDTNEPAPFAGVLVPRRRYDYLIRCEGFFVRERGNP